MDSYILILPRSGIQLGLREASSRFVSRFLECILPTAEGQGEFEMKNYNSKREELEEEDQREDERNVIL